jgi:hypothetical protein
VATATSLLCATAFVVGAVAGAMAALGVRRITTRAKGRHKRS